MDLPKISPSTHRKSPEKSPIIGTEHLAWKEFIVEDEKLKNKHFSIFYIFQIYDERYTTRFSFSSFNA